MEIRILSRSRDAFRIPWLPSLLRVESPSNVELNPRQLSPQNSKMRMKTQILVGFFSKGKKALSFRVSLYG